MKIPLQVFDTNDTRQYVVTSAKDMAIYGGVAIILLIIYVISNLIGFAVGFIFFTGFLAKIILDLLIDKEARHYVFKKKVNRLELEVESQTVTSYIWRSIILYIIVIICLIVGFYAVGVSLKTHDIFKLIVSILITGLSAFMLGAMLATIIKLLEEDEKVDERIKEMDK